MLLPESWIEESKWPIEFYFLRQTMFLSKCLLFINRWTILGTLLRSLFGGEVLLSLILLSFLSLLLVHPVFEKVIMFNLVIGAESV